MRAVILAAGAGNRLRPIVGPWPKCLAHVGGCTLIERQIDQLHECGIAQIAAVLGHRRDQVERVCGDRCEVIENRDYASTNSLYSLWLARDLLRDGFVVLNCDVLCHPRLIARLLASRHEDALLMARRAPGSHYGDEEMKVHARRGRVIAISKTLPDAQCDGENVGIAKFGAAGAAALCEHLDRLVQAGAVREWLPRAFDEFCRTRPLHVVETAGLPWIEIDFPEDYARACREVLPAIAAAERSPAAALRAGDDPFAISLGRTVHRV